MCQRLGLRVAKEKCKELVPLFVWYENFTKRSDDICDIFLKERYWFINKSLQKECFCLFSVFLCQLHPQVPNNFSQIYARHLPNILVFTGGHEYEKVLQCLYVFEVVLKDSCSLLNSFCIWLEELAEQLGEL